MVKYLSELNVIDFLIETGMLSCKSSDIPIEVERRIEDAGKLVEREGIIGLLVNYYFCHTLN